MGSRGSSKTFSKLSSENSDNSNFESLDPEIWVKRINTRNKGLLKLRYLKKLKQILDVAEDSWKYDFFQSGGFDAFSNIFKNAPFSSRIHLEVIQCLVAYTNGQMIDLILSTRKLLSNIVNCLGKRSESLRVRVLELLTIFCWLTSEGRNLVIIKLELCK